MIEKPLSVPSRIAWKLPTADRLPIQIGTFKRCRFHTIVVGQTYAYGVHTTGIHSTNKA
jgi:hypothetical protein